MHVAVRSGGSRACATADVECAGDSDTTGSWNQSASSIADDEYRFRDSDCASYNDLTTGHDADTTRVWQPATTEHVAREFTADHVAATKPSGRATKSGAHRNRALHTAWTRDHSLPLRRRHTPGAKRRVPRMERSHQVPRVTTSTEATSDS